MIKVDNFPKMIIFDVLNVCNLNCLHCPHKELIKSDNFKPAYLDFKLFKKIVDEISNYEVDLVRFTGDGEPLLHKDIVQMLKYAKFKIKGKINLTTNGLLLNEETSEFLLNLPVDFIDISIDAFTEEKYNLIRRGGDFKKLMSNVDKLIELKSVHKSPTKIMVNMINQDLVKDEVEPFKKHWSSLVDYVLVRNLHTVNNYLDADAEVIKSDGGRYPCPHLYKRITVDFNGNVKFCAHDWFDYAIVGNLNSNSIKDIWSGSQYEALRQYHEAEEFYKVPLCRDCRDWKSVPWDYGYDKVIKKLNAKEVK